MTLVLVISNFNLIVKYMYKHKSGLTNIGFDVLITYMIFNAQFPIDLRKSGDMWRQFS